MSITDFDAWLRRDYEEDGAFTALVVLVAIDETSANPVASTFVNVIGTEVTWAELVRLFAGSGQTWDGAAFFPRRDAAGDPLPNALARIALRDLELRLEEDRLVLNEGHFFDAWGRRLRIDETTLQ